MAGLGASAHGNLDDLVYLRKDDLVDCFDEVGFVFLNKSHCNSFVRASAPYSTLSSANAAGTTSILALDQFVIRRRSSARNGPNSASPALLMPPPMTIRAGFNNMIADFNPSARSTTYRATK